MNENVNLSYNLRRYLQNSQSPEARAFFDGARSMMTALQLTPASDYPSVLSTSNQQHIIALLVQSDEQQRARRRNDVQQMLKLYDVDKMRFLAFVFDLPAINIDGQAVGENGEVLEDDSFHLQPGKNHDGWPHRKIAHYDDSHTITRAEYVALSEEDQQEYCYHRYFDLTLNGRPAFRVCSSDHYLMEELIRQSVLIGDPLINRRYLTEIYSSAEDCTVGNLYSYRNAILNAFAELSEDARDYAIAPIITAQAKCGYIRSIGQLRIALVFSLLTAAKPLDLLKLSASDIEMLGKIIRACANDNDGELTELAELITDEDIRTYQTPNGDYLPGIVWHTVNDEKWFYDQISYLDGATLKQQKDYFKRCLISEKLCPRLCEMLNRILTRDDLTTIEAEPSRLKALMELQQHLAANGFPSD